MCSVDVGSDGTDSTASHVFTWQLDEDSNKNLTHSLICQLPLLASVVQPHPEHVDLWLIGGVQTNDTGAVGVFSSTSTNTSNIKEYTNLPMHAILVSEVVSDVSFSADGCIVIAAVHPRGETSVGASVVTWRMNYLPGSSTSYSESSLSPCFKVAVPNCVAVRGSSVGILTASVISSMTLTPSSPLTADIHLQCWPILNNNNVISTTEHPTQLVRVALPVVETPHRAAFKAVTLLTSASQEFSRLDVSLILSKPTDPYVVIAHRLVSISIWN